MKITKIIASLLIVSAIAVLPGCSEIAGMSEASAEDQKALSSGVTEAPENAIGKFLKEYETFEVTSSDLNDGVWADIISKTDIGENRSPQLSWSPVEGADSYVIYMVDSNTNGFLHWKSGDVTSTDLPQGWASAVEYAGPHIGHGYTHVFDIYVIAVKSSAGQLKGAVNSVNPNLDEFIQMVDTGEDGTTGNIISYGKISGAYTDSRFRGDRTVDENKPYYM